MVSNFFYIDGCFSFCFYGVITNFLKNRTTFVIRRQAFASLQHGFLRSVECDGEYIGESSRTFGERFKEHLKAPSLIYDHFNTTGHNITIDNFSIVGREDQNLSELIKEALFIRVNHPSLNKNTRKYHLPHIWDEALLNTSELKLK